MFQTVKVIVLTVVLVTVVTAQGFITFKTKLEGAKRVGEVPYTIPFTVTAET